MGAAERIKQRRIELGMTQDELAKKLGYKSRSSVNKVETSRDLSLKKVKEYANALECTPAYLMGWEESEPDSITVSIESDSKNTLPSATEIEIIKSFRNADDQVKDMILYLLKLSEPNK